MTFLTSEHDLFTFFLTFWNLQKIMSLELFNQIHLLTVR